MSKFDFSGWATRNDIRCSDGRTIMKDAFKHCDGAKVPLVWNHQHTRPEDVLGHAILENRNEGVYAYCSFNDSESGELAKVLVKHGDITALSIYANQLRQDTSKRVMHGVIREVSLVHAGANPEAFIENVLIHSDSGEFVRELEDEAVFYTVTGDAQGLSHSDEDMEEENMSKGNGKSVQDIINSMSEEQRDVMYGLIGEALEHGDIDDDEEEYEYEEDEDEEYEDEEDEEYEDDEDDEEEYEYEDEDEEEYEDEDSEGGNDNMKHNVFDMDNTQRDTVLSHAAQQEILDLAKQSNVGSFQAALEMYANDNLMHGDNVGVFEDYGVLFPEFELLKKGEPETLYKYDQGWVGPALAKIHKSPYSRIRTRFADARIAELNAKGYKNKGEEKTAMGQIKIINRETTPQTIYIKDSLHRDDIIDVTDFDIVGYQWRQMRRVLDETIILAAMVGDGRADVDPDKIKEDNIRPIWKDDEEYTIHYDVDIEAARAQLQGTDTNKHFSENYIYAESIIMASLYSREKFKGTGTPDFYCTPHLVNVMLLARDLNGRRIYDSKADLAKALNCNSIIEVEHFEGLTREDKNGNTKELLGLFVNLNDYTFGATRGGEITKFEDFDIDFNMKKFLLETRLSGSLYKLKSAIALEKPVDEEVAG